MPIIQVSVFLDNRPGSLSKAMDQLDKNQIEIFALSIADAGEFGLIRMITENPEKTTKILEEKDFNLAKSKKNTEVTAIFISVAALAQPSSIEKVIKKYSGQEGVTTVNISPELFQIISDMDVQEIADADVPFDKLTAVKVLVVENAELLANGSFYDEVTDGLNTDDYAEVLSVREGDEDVRMWMKTEGKQIREFLLVVSEPSEGVLVYIAGDFNMSDIEGLAQEFGGLENIEGLEDLKIN